MTKVKMTKTRQLLIDKFIQCLEEDRILWAKPWKVVHPVRCV